VHFEDLHTVIAWMESPFEDSGTWTSVSWWDQAMPEGMAEAIVAVCEPGVREALVGLRESLPATTAAIQKLEEEWGELPMSQILRHVRTDLFVVEHLEKPVGIEDNPIGRMANIGALLDFVIELDLSKDVSH
jgi:hypothetical protein